MKKRALRRHHRQRLLKKRQRDFWWINDWFANRFTMYGRVNPDKFRSVINTPTPCSCNMCGNPRKYFGKIKKKEILSYITMIEQCEENGIYTSLRKNNIPSKE